MNSCIPPEKKNRLEYEIPRKDYKHLCIKEMRKIQVTVHIPTVRLQLTPMRPTQPGKKKTTQQKAHSAHCQPDQPSKKLTPPIVNPAQSQPGGLAQSKSTRTNANQDQRPMPAQPKANQANLAKSQPAKANPAQSEPGSLSPKSNQAASLNKSYNPYLYWKHRSYQLYPCSQTSG